MNILCQCIKHLAYHCWGLCFCWWHDKISELKIEAKKVSKELAMLYIHDSSDSLMSLSHSIWKMYVYADFRAQLLRSGVLLFLKSTAVRGNWPEVPGENVGWSYFLSEVHVSHYAQCYSLCENLYYMGHVFLLSLGAFDKPSRRPAVKL